MFRIVRFLNSFLRSPAGHIHTRDVTIGEAGQRISASYFRPYGTAPVPGWIILHGITVPGRRHPVLVRFARALANSGAAVLIPDVPAWRQLSIDPSPVDPTIATAAAYLQSRADVSDGKLNLVGFSFGATQALMSAARPAVQDSIGTVLSFGGYCDLGRTLTCMMTGEHEWNGVHYRFEPDPYGRWIVVGNCLTAAPEFAHMDALQEAAIELATEVGRRGAYAADRVYDPFKAELRDRLPSDQREIWDLIAPPAGAMPPTEAGRQFAARLLEAAYNQYPGLDPRPLLPQVKQRVILAHGREDRLIPYTETLRMRQHLLPWLDASMSITRLFAHSREADRLNPFAYPREIVRYFALLNRVLNSG